MTEDVLTRLGDLPIERFLERFWQRRPYVARRALADWTPPLDASELAGLACEEGVESRLVREPVPGRFEVEPGPFTADVLSTLPRRGWSLLVNALDRLVPEAEALLNRFRFVPAFRLDDVMASVAPGGGSVGPHVDRYDVFLLQASGRRRWRFDADASVTALRPVDAANRVGSPFEPTEDTVLEPGDVLYLPPGVAHHGIAVGDDCTTYSIGCRAPALRNLVGAWSTSVMDRLDDEASVDPKKRRLLDDPDRAPLPHPAAIDDVTLAATRRALEGLLDSPDALADAVGLAATRPWRFQDRPPTVDEPDLGHAAAIAEILETGGALRRAWPAALARYARPDGGIVLYAGGERFVFEPSQTALVDWISDGRPLTRDGAERLGGVRAVAETLAAIARSGALVEDVAPEHSR